MGEEDGRCTEEGREQTEGAGNGEWEPGKKNAKKKTEEARVTGGLARGGSRLRGRGSQKPGDGDGSWGSRVSVEDTGGIACREREGAEGGSRVSLVDTDGVIELTVEGREQTEGERELTMSTEAGEVARSTVSMEEALKDGRGEETEGGDVDSEHRGW